MFDLGNQLFDGGDVLTMWSTEWPGDSEMPTVAINDSTIVALQTYETVMCSRTFNSVDDMAGQTVKIATWGGVDAVTKFINEFGEANNVNFAWQPVISSNSNNDLSVCEKFVEHNSDLFEYLVEPMLIDNDSSIQCLCGHFNQEGHDLWFSMSKNKVKKIIELNH